MAIALTSSRQHTSASLPALPEPVYSPPAYAAGVQPLADQAGSTPHPALLRVPSPAVLRLAPPPRPVSTQAVPTARNAGDVCPLSLISVDALQHPYLAQDGYIYERDVLYQSLLHSDRSPMTREPMPETSHAVLGYTGEAHRTARKTAGAMRTPQAALLAVTATGLVAGGLVGPVTMLCYNKTSTAWQFPTLLMASSAPLGAAVIGAASFSVGLYFCRRAQINALRREIIAMRQGIQV